MSCDGERRRERKKQVDVVFDAADGEGLHVVLASDASQIGPEACLEVGVDELAALFGREDDVVEGADVGVWHGDLEGSWSREPRPVGTIRE
jgi:hypothetical protein